jgi:RNA polymerase sigma-54 factor
MAVSYRLSQSLQTTLSQKLTLTPSLLQKIELLTMSNLDLCELINQEMTANPVLEDARETDDRQEVIEAAGVDEKEDVSVAERLDDTPGKDSLEDINYDDFFSDYMESEPRTHEREADNEDRPTFESFLVRPISLAEHLNWQLSMVTVSEKIRDLAEKIIGNLDENGFLDWPIEELCASEACSLEQMEEALHLVQGFDPVGVAARDVKECLLLQLSVVKRDVSLERRLIEEFLPLIQAHKFKEICSKMSCDAEDLSAALDVIRGLNPTPGRKYGAAEPIYVIPEVIIAKVENDFVIFMNDDGMPRLRLNSSYRAMIKGALTSQETREFLRDKIRSAVDLIRNIDQRQQTLYRVCKCIIQRQRDFLENGVKGLKPMLIKDVAAELGVHSSTISRVVTNKYIDTPQGVMELRKFFTTGVEKEDGGEISTLNVKTRSKR